MVISASSLPPAAMPQRFRGSAKAIQSRVAAQQVEGLATRAILGAALRPLCTGVGERMMERSPWETMANKDQATVSERLQQLDAIAPLLLCSRAGSSAPFDAVPTVLVVARKLSFVRRG